MKRSEINHLNEIPNRYHFIELIEKVALKEKRFSLMLMDVMNFSDVSSAFGHKSGDTLLIQIANKIQSIFPHAQAIGRISGDIFGVVFTSSVTPSALRNEHSRLYDHFKSPLTIDNTAFIVDFNVGVSVRKNPKSNVNRIISLAESALKKSKSNQHENFSLLNDDTQEGSGRGLTLKADLKRALANDELELFIQPKVDLTNYKIIGGECLLRWNHPLDGVVFPGSLLKAAESYNMMNELGYWTLESCLKLISIMATLGYEVPISVNLSPTQLYDPQLVKTLKILINQYKVNTRFLELELTEDVALSNSLLVKRQLQDIKDLGISLAMDDFGKGYSNLSFIRDLELNAVKIDKTFVLEINESPVNIAIVQATKTICDAKNCETFAEGIESMEQLLSLKDIGVNKGQGFLFSKAIPFRVYLELLERGDFVHLFNGNQLHAG